MANLPASGPGGTIDQPQYTEEELKIQKALEKFNFSDIFDEVKNLALKNIAKYPQEQQGFLIDLEKISTNIPIDKNEKKFIETKYLKGYGQMVDTPYGKLSFAEIQGHEKRDEILGNMKLSQRDKFDDWEINVANQSNEGKKTELIKTDNANEGKKTELININNRLSLQLEELQRINGVPKPDINNLRESALQEPPTILGETLTREDIESKKYDNIILANYYKKNEAIITSGLGEAEKLQFTTAIQGIRKTLDGNISTKEFTKLTESKALGSARDDINARGEKIIESKNIKSISWNPDTREIILKGERETYILETIPVPPREKLIRGALSISREIPKVSEKEKEYKKIEGEKQKGENELTKALNTMEFADLREIPDDLKEEEELKNYKHAKDTWNTGGSPESILTNISGLRHANEVLDQKLENKRIESLQENKDSTTYERLKHELWKEKQSLSGLMITLQKSQSLNEQSKKLKGELPIDNDTSFESNARYNIEMLSRLGVARSFRNMDEVYGFLMTQRGSGTSQDWGDAESINTYLGREKLQGAQLEQLLISLTKIHDTIRQDKISELTGNEAKVTALNHDEGDGMSRLQKSLDIYRKRNEGKILGQSDFERLLSENI